MPALATITLDVLAAKSGVDTATLLSYQRLGLVPKPQRVANELLLYRTDDVERVVFIRRAIALGFSVEAVRELLGLAGKKPKACADVHEIASRHLADIRRRRAELAQMERALAPLVDSCPRRGGLAACPIMSSLSHLDVPSSLHEADLAP
jgi:DNA-binding transcriptional MerR regulator